MGDGPEISVVVGAYSRPTYLMDAVRSVRGQTFPRDRIELVVVKNFRDEAIDRDLEAAGARVRFDDEPALGPWLLGAIRSTHAPVVTVLDDDDLFLPDRLAHVAEVFRSRPDVGFYRNRVEIIDAHGTLVPRSEWRPKGVDPYFDASGPIVIAPEGKTALVDLLFLRTRAGFNLSSMAFRRDLLDGPRGDCFAESRLPDLALLFAAVVAPCGMYLDDRRLTRHRVHPSNTTRRVDWLAWSAGSHRRLSEQALEFGKKDLAAYLRRQADHFDRLHRGGVLAERVAGNAGRREVAGGLAEYLRFLGRHPEERRWTLDVYGAAGYGAAYLVLPGLARRVQRRRGTASPVTGASVLS